MHENKTMLEKEIGLVSVFPVSSKSRLKFYNPLISKEGNRR